MTKNTRLRLDGDLLCGSSICPCRLMSLMCLACLLLDMLTRDGVSMNLRRLCSLVEEMNSWRPCVLYFIGSSGMISRVLLRFLLIYPIIEVRCYIVYRVRMRTRLNL